MNIPAFAVVITAAGASERFNKGKEVKVKKEYLQIDGHTVLYRATEPFLEIPGTSAIIVTCPEGSEDETIVALEDIANIGELPILIIPGGKSRTESVRKALNTLSELPISFDYIAIHDGARPFVKPDLIIKTLAAATIAGAAAPALRETDALKSLNNGFIEKNVDRTSLIRVQTPQIFTRENLLQAYSSLPAEASLFDDIEVYTNAGYKCTVVQGSEENKKITYFDDIPDAESQIEEYIKVRDKGRANAKASRRMRELMNMKEEE